MLYVDDILVIGNYVLDIAKISFKVRFSMKDLG
jgi:hypothetical protein